MTPVQVPMRSQRGGGRERWCAPSISVHRSQRSVVVNVRGGLDCIAAAKLRHILVDLVEGQGNLFVRVDYDVLAEASVFAILATLEVPSSRGPVEGSIDGSLSVRGRPW